MQHLAVLLESLPEMESTGLPPVDWQKAGVDHNLRPDPVPFVTDPGAWRPDAALPRADVVVMTWTVAEWAALNHVFCNYQREMTPDEIKESAWRRPWPCYARDYCQIHQYMTDVKRDCQGGAPSLTRQAWGKIRMVSIGGLKVLLIKSDMHLAQDGTDLPLTKFVQRICREAMPGLLLSIGTAGGIRSDDALGSVLVTNQAFFYLIKEFKNAGYNGSTVKSTWTPAEEFINTAQNLLLQVPGYPILPISPQYPAGAEIKPDIPASKIKLLTDRPIITTDGFLFGTTTHENGLTPELGCMVEMDDAVVGMICKSNNTSFGFVRNVSDPVINGALPAKLQEAWAAYIYQEKGLYTSFNGALASWALIAGEARKRLPR